MTPQTLQEQLPGSVTEAGARLKPERYTHGHGSMETLWAVLALITIVGVVAGIIARVCGGRHLGGHDGGEADFEGCVDKHCRSCLDGGLPPSQSPPAVAAPQPQAEETNAADK